MKSKDMSESNNQIKVFISYSWSSEVYQNQVLKWADQLINDGIEVILDQYDLKEGQDKYSFMERMVTDKSISHVLIFSEKTYTEKANNKKSGVGTESQIISSEIYEKVDQSKFIPIVCEFSDDGKPFLPTFLKNRKWIDFSTPEAINKNWEFLIRALYGKPLHTKPRLGEPPKYISEDSTRPTNPTVLSFNLFRQALFDGKKGLDIYRKDFLNSCISYISNFKGKEKPSMDSIDERIIDDCMNLKVARDMIIDWILIDSELSTPYELWDILQSFLENLHEFKCKPMDASFWNNYLFEAPSIFVYETFIYIIASLIKTKSFVVLHEMLTTHYFVDKSKLGNPKDFSQFDCFYHNSDILQKALAPEGRKLYSPVAELVYRQADRNDIPFSSLNEADALILLMALITKDIRWFPQTLFYAQNRTSYPLFRKAKRHRDFEYLSTITGISESKIMKESVLSGFERMGVNNWQVFIFNDSLSYLYNLDGLDSIK